MGELTLVLELGYQPHVCHAGDVVTTVGTSIHQDHPAAPAISRQASTDSCIFR